MHQRWFTPGSVNQRLRHNKNNKLIGDGAYEIFNPQIILGDYRRWCIQPLQPVYMSHFRVFFLYRFFQNEFFLYQGLILNLSWK